MVVEAGTGEMPIVETEPKGFDEVQMRPGIGTSDRIARIGESRPKEDDMKHEAAFCAQASPDSTSERCPRENQILDPGNARRLEGARELIERRARRHDIVDDQHRNPAKRGART